MKTFLTILAIIACFFLMVLIAMLNDMLQTKRCLDAPLDNPSAICKDILYEY